MDAIEREAEDLLRYRAELGRRLARVGVQDVPALIGLYQQLRTALGALSAQEIEWARTKAERLAEDLERIEQQLAALRRLKGRLSV